MVCRRMHCGLQKDALWFAEGFGLMPTTLQFEAINSHQPVTLDLQQKTCTLLPSDDDRTMQIVTGEII